MVSRFAQDTEVPIARSRAEIEKLLRNWKCDGIRWTDLYSRGLVFLEFMWNRSEDESYLARFHIQLPTDDQLSTHAIDQRSGRVSLNKLERLKEGRGRMEHRILALWLKAALNAVEAGIVNAETLFLPWLVGGDGQTVADVAIPKLQKLLGGSATRLLALPVPKDS